MWISKDEKIVRLEDYCNRTKRGSKLRYTSSIVYMDEELLFHELGERVAIEILGLAIDGWGAFMDALYEEQVRGTSSVPNV